VGGAGRRVKVVVPIARGAGKVCIKRSLQRVFHCSRHFVGWWAGGLLTLSTDILSVLCEVMLYVDEYEKRKPEKSNNFAFY
jgi:hypothetical protein